MILVKIESLICLEYKTQYYPRYQKDYYAANAGGHKGALGQIAGVAHKTVINPSGRADGKQKGNQTLTHKLIIAENQPK